MQDALLGPVGETRRERETRAFWELRQGTPSLSPQAKPTSFRDPVMQRPKSWRHSILTRESAITGTVWLKETEWGMRISILLFPYPLLSPESHMTPSYPLGSN